MWSLCVCALNLVLVGPVQVKSMWIHVQSHWIHSRQILKRKTGGTSENRSHDDSKHLSVPALYNPIKSFHNITIHLVARGSTKNPSYNGIDHCSLVTVILVEISIMQHCTCQWWYTMKMIHKCSESHFPARPTFKRAHQTGNIERANEGVILDTV